MSVTRADALEALDGDALVTVRWVRELLADLTSPPPASDELRDLTIEEVAAQLGKAPSTIRSWCASGSLAGAYRAGRTWRVPRAALDALRASPARKPDPPALPTGRPVDLGRWRLAKGERKP